jgi:hypothetical protein
MLVWKDLDVPASAARAASVQIPDDAFRLLDPIPDGGA